MNQNIITISIHPISIPNAQKFDISVQQSDLCMKIKSQTQQKLPISQDLLCYIHNGTIISEMQRVSSLKLQDKAIIQVYNLNHFLQFLNYPSQSQFTLTQTIDDKKSQDHLTQQLEKCQKEKEKEINSLKNYYEQQIAIKAQQITEQSNQLVEYEEYIQSMTKDQEQQRKSFLLKYQDLNNQMLKRQYEQKEIETQLNSLKEETVVLKQTIKLQDKDITFLRQKLQNSQLGTNSNINSQIEFEVKEFEEKIKTQEFTIDKLTQEKLKLQQVLSDLNNRYAGASTEFSNQKIKFENEIDALNGKINHLSSQISKYQQKIKELEQDLQENLVKIRSLTDKATQSEIQAHNQSAKIANKDEQIQILNNQLKDLEASLNKKKVEKDKKEDELSKQTEESQEKIKKLKLEEVTLRKELAISQAELGEREKTISNLENTIKQMEQIQQQMKLSFKKMQQESEAEISKAKLEVQQSDKKKQQLIGRLKMLQPKKTDKLILSASEDLYRSVAEILTFDQGGNVHTDEVTYKVQKLNFTADIHEQVFKQNDLDIRKVIQHQDVGQWKVIKSVNPNGSGSRKQLFLFKVLQSETKEFENKVFGYRSIQGEEQNSIDKAIETCKNALVTKFLLDYFNTKLQGAYDGKFTKFFIPDQYLISADGRFMVAEEIHEGQFTKYNGEGDSVVKDEKLQQYLNAFSCFTYNISKQQYIITNLQGVKNVIYDPIVSTQEGFFSEEDLGEDEMISFSQQAKEEPKKYGKVYLQCMGIKI